MIIGKRGSLVILRGTDAIITFAGGNKIFALVSNSSSASKPCTGKPRNGQWALICKVTNISSEFNSKHIQNVSHFGKVKKLQIARSHYASKARVEEEDDQQTRGEIVTF